MKDLELLSSTKYLFIFAFTIVLIAFTSCGKEEISPDHMDIDTYIKSLEYNQNSILNVQSTTGGNTNRHETNDETVRTAPEKGNYIECRNVSYQLDKNFDKVSILRPTNGIIWPGALVYGDKDMLTGLPRPITLDRSPVSLRLDLPGMEEEGNINVENPKNSSVQTGINKALEWWNANEYDEGYINASLSEYQSSVSYSSNQLAMDIGLNAEWASGSIESQLNVESNQEREVATMIFKQVFYSITTDTPSTPGSVFGKDVTLIDVESNMDENTPPAYVSAVDYGRIIMFRIEANRSSVNISLDAVLEYATGVGNGIVNTSYDQVLKNNSTSINVITIGGNAETTSEAVQASGPGSLGHILTGENAVYSRDNPGLPISYTVQFLKDNKLAKMGYTTDYTISECEGKKWNHSDITIKNTFQQKNIRVKLSYKRNNGSSTSTDWQTIKDETHEGITLDQQVPNGAYDVRMNVEKYEFGNGWDDWVEKNLYHVSSSESCWEAYVKSNGDRGFRKC